MHGISQFILNIEEHEDPKLTAERQQLVVVDASSSPLLLARLIWSATRTCAWSPSVNHLH